MTWGFLVWACLYISSVVSFAVYVILIIEYIMAYLFPSLSKVAARWKFLGVVFCGLLSVNFMIKGHLQ